MALTADGWEAELITPPVPLNLGAPNLIASMLEAEHGRLLNSLGELDQYARLVGFSTHVNISVDDSVVVGVAREFARRCAVAAGLLLDGADSPGVLVRPRRGRLEICGEYATGEDLSASIVFVAAAAAALADPGAVLPAVGNWRVEPARERFGFFVGRDATGSDLYQAGRRASVSLDGRTVLAQHHLETLWSLLRPHAVSLGLDPRPVDERVVGIVPLPVERAIAALQGSTHAQADSTTSDLLGTRERLTLLGPGIPARQRGAMLLVPTWLTWSTAAWRCEDTEQGRSVYAVMPVEFEQEFLHQLDAGRLDGLLARSIRGRARRQVLTSADNARRPKIWRDLRPESLVPAERDQSGKIARPGAGSGSGDEARTKDRNDEATPPTHPVPHPTPGAASADAGSRSHGFPRGLLMVAAAGALLFGGGAIWALTGFNDEPTTARAPSSLGPVPPVTPTASRSASDPPETGEPTVQPPTAKPWSVTYVGTLDSGPGPGPGPEEGFRMGIFCPDDTGRGCNFAGFSVFGWDVLSSVQLFGPGSYTATYVDPAYTPCDVPRDGSGPPTTLKLTLDEKAVSWAIESAGTGLVDCGDGSQAEIGASSTSFEGTYVDGSLPGFAP